MATDVTKPRVEDLVSVGSRISWGAIMAGTVVALGLQFLLGVLGAAVGVSISNRVDADILSNSAIAWSILIACASLFVGGLVTSQFTVGENKMEAMLYGVIMWAVLFVVLLGLGAAGSARWSAMVGMAELAQSASAESWESAALRAGIPADSVTDLRNKLAGTEKKKDATESPATAASIADNANRIAWFAFAGTWLSMFAAAFGALVGAGPTFRLATVAVPQYTITVSTKAKDTSDNALTAPYSFSFTTLTPPPLRGNLQINIGGLPLGEKKVRVTGPEFDSGLLDESTLFSNVLIGDYTLVASAFTVAPGKVACRIHTPKREVQFLISVNSNQTTTTTMTYEAVSCAPPKL